MESMIGPRELKNFFKREVGTMSKGLEEGRIWETISLSSSKEFGLNWLNQETRAGQSTPGMPEGDILALISLTLFTKNDKNNLQSSLEKIGTGGGVGLVNLSIVLNRTRGLFLLE